jgi:hypothetical protein
MSTTRIRSDLRAVAKCGILSNLPACLQYVLALDELERNKRSRFTLRTAFKDGLEGWSWASPVRKFKARIASGRNLFPNLT